jgi:Zn-finger nucleic acid-binding protein
MLRHAHKDNPAVTVDECPGCGGFWLDAGELGLIRRSHILTEKKRAHTQALLEQLKRQSLAGLHQKPEGEKRRAHSITTINAFFHAWPE